MDNVKTFVFRASGEAPSRIKIISFRDQLSSVLDSVDRENLGDADRAGLAAGVRYARAKGVTLAETAKLLSDHVAAHGNKIVAILRSAATVDLTALEMGDLQALLDDRLPQLL